jgi:hypothetical protein
MANPAWYDQNSPLNRLLYSVDNPFQVKVPVVGNGSVIAFNYVGQTRHRIHDPYPLVIVAKITQDMLFAVNLHYLTLPYVRSIVLAYANNPQFSFRFISNDAYISNAFRSYKRKGISDVRLLDIGFLKNLLTVVRALDPNEIEMMREQVHRQLMEQPEQPKAIPGPEVMPNG